ESRAAPCRNRPEPPASAETVPPMVAFPFAPKKSQCVGSKPKHWFFAASTDFISSNDVPGRTVRISSSGSYLTMPDRSLTSATGRSPIGLPTLRLVPPPTISNGRACSRADRTYSTISASLESLVIRSAADAERAVERHAHAYGPVRHRPTGWEK